jgi:hypothetical protein
MWFERSGGSGDGDLQERRKDGKRKDRVSVSAVAARVARQPASAAQNSRQASRTSTLHLRHSTLEYQNPFHSPSNTIPLRGDSEATRSRGSQ